MSRFKLITIGAAVLIVLLLVSAAIVVPKLGAGKQEVTAADPASIKTETDVKKAITSAQDADDNRHVKRALWDDSKYQPGTNATDPQGRWVYTPENPNCEPPATLPSNYDGAFSFQESTDYEVVQQYVHGRFIIVGDRLGPANCSSAIPSDLSKTVAAAAVAASNFFTFALQYSDPLAIEYWRQNTKGEITDKVLAEGVKQQVPTAIPDSGYSAFKVVSMDQKRGIVVLDTALQVSIDTQAKKKLDRPQYSISRYTLQRDDATKNWLVLTDEDTKPQKVGMMETIPKVGWSTFIYNKG